MLALEVFNVRAIAQRRGNGIASGQQVVLAQRIDVKSDPGAIVEDENLRGEIDLQNVMSRVGTQRVLTVVRSMKE